MKINIEKFIITIYVLFNYLNDLHTCSARLILTSDCNMIFTKNYINCIEILLLLNLIDYDYENMSM